MNEYILEAAGVKGELLNRVRHYGLLASRLQQIEKAEAAENTRHVQALQALRQQRKTLQAECDHPESAVTYHGDPAGGGDSEHHCHICDASDKYLRHKSP